MKDTIKTERVIARLYRLAKELILEAEALSATLPQKNNGKAGKIVSRKKLMEMARCRE